MSKKGQKYRKITREEKLKAVKLYLERNMSMPQIEKDLFGYKKCTGCIARWIIEYRQEGEEKAFRKNKGVKKTENEPEMRYEILKKFNAFLDKEIRLNSSSLKKTKKNTQ